MKSEVVILQDDSTFLDFTLEVVLPGNDLTHLKKKSTNPHFTIF